MVGQQGSVTVGSLEQGSGRWPRMAGGAILIVGAVAVAVVGVIGVGQVREGSTSSKATREAAAPPASVANEPAGAAITSGPASSFLYLVDSAEEAALIRAFPGGVDQLGSHGSAPPVQTAVLVGSTLDRATVEQLPGRLIVDLRGPAPTAPAKDALARELEALTIEGLGVPRAP